MKKHLKDRRRIGFTASRLYRRREPHAFHFLKKSASFLIASISLIAFVAGNMVGQHGWQVFWKSVWGQGDDSLVVYTGTVAPIAQIPDYERWMRYGGTIGDHTYRQVPQDVLMPLPRYEPKKGGDVYSVEYMGSYTDGKEDTGSHPAVDIRVPEGTPVLAVANAIVSETKNDPKGFGNVIVLKHPRVPDPSRPSKFTMLYSNYAHLSSIIVKPGDIVQKGEVIGYSGSTGMVSGPHLHFQIDRSDAPWHPYWPFDGAEMRKAGIASVSEAINTGFHSERGYAFTVNPMLYVQSNFAPIAAAVVEKEPLKEPSLSPAERLKRLRGERLQARMDRRSITRQDLAVAQSATKAVLNVAEIAAAPLPKVEPSIVKHDVVVTDTRDAKDGTVAGISIDHDGSFSGRSWERVRIRILDDRGNPVLHPVLTSDLYLRTIFDNAEFRPAVLSARDFRKGEAVIEALPRGRRTVVIQVMPFATISEPMEYEGN